MTIQERGSQYLVDYLSTAADVFKLLLCSLNKLGEHQTLLIDSHVLCAEECKPNAQVQPAERQMRAPSRALESLQMGVARQKTGVDVI